MECEVVGSNPLPLTLTLSLTVPSTLTLPITVVTLPPGECDQLHRGLDVSTHGGQALQHDDGAPLAAHGSIHRFYPHDGHLPQGHLTLTLNGTLAGLVRSVTCSHC